MPLNHVLAADGFGAPLDELRRERALSVLSSFGFHRSGDAFVVDEQFDWATVTESDGRLHVHVLSPLPEHLLDQVLNALEGLVIEVGLVRTDPISRRVITPVEWRRMVEDEHRKASRGLR